MNAMADTAMTMDGSKAMMDSTMTTADSASH